MISLFFPFILSAAIGSLDPMAVYDPTVSGSDFVVSEDIEIENKIDSVVEALPEEKIVLRDTPLFSTYSYSNDNFIGYNYYTISTSSDITFTFLCNGFTYLSVGYVSSQNIYRFMFGSDNGGKTLYIDFNGRILTYTLDTQGRLYANKSDFTISGSGITFTVTDSGVVSSSGGGGDDPLPEEPDDPIVSGGDYAEVLHSIDDRLNYFEDLFYYGSSIDDMGNGFKVIIVLIFLVTINIVLKIINWR